MTPFDPGSPEFGLLDESQCLCGKPHLVDSMFCQECENMIENMARENDYDDSQDSND